MAPRSRNPKVLAIVLAGGEGKRLMPLTADRAKPAVPFGGIYRLVDFALSNVVNSGYLKVVVLTQYKSHSLDRHIAKTWRMSHDARQLRRPGPGAAAGGQALVPGQRRRHLPEPQPGARRAARHRRGRRRRPRLPHGLPPDGRAAHRSGRRGHGRGHPSAASSSPTSSASSRSTPRTRAKIARFLEKPTRPRGPARPPARCSPRWATTSSTPTPWSTR